MAELKLDELPDGKVVIVEPFKNGTGMKGDDWLKLGLRNYITDLLRSGHDLRALSGVIAKYGLGGENVDFRVGGMFQRIGNKLRVFIHLKNGSDEKLIKQFGAAFPYPDSLDFFNEIAKTSKKLMKEIDVKVDDKVLRTVQNATTSVRAYEDYSKGRQALETYDPGKTKLAKTWFDQAKRADFRSPIGYQGSIDLYTFLGFYNRQMGNSFSGYYQSAQSELIKMKKLARPAPMLMFPKKAKVTKKRQLEIELENPFILNNISFVEGIQSEQQSMWRAAAKAFTNAVESIPVDAISWYHLALVEAKSGKAGKSKDAMQKALSINKCLQPGGVLTGSSVTSPSSAGGTAISTSTVPMKPIQTLTPKQQRGMLIVPEAAKSKTAQPKRWENN